MAETDKDKLKKMTAWDTAPTLTEGEIDELLAPSALSIRTELRRTLSVGWRPTT